MASDLNRRPFCSKAKSLRELLALLHIWPRIDRPWMCAGVRCWSWRLSLTLSVSRPNGGYDPWLGTLRTVAQPFVFQVSRISSSGWMRWDLASKRGDRYSSKSPATAEQLPRLLQLTKYSSPSTIPARPPCA
jgi:hypothetical protein